ncbi:hypothetical protein LINGRAPRIM_LOCUS2689 [Linum grandiflorum]
MSSFNKILSNLAQTHVLYINDHMHSSKHQAFYLSSIKRPILPSIRVDLVAFQKYGLYPYNRLEGRLQEGRLSSIVDGYCVVVTPQLLTTVLGLPPGGRPIFDESDLHRIRFFPSAVLGRWTNSTHGATYLAVISDLPDYLKVVHYFITRICLPRSDSLYLVNGIDIWLLHCAVLSERTDFSCLMFASLVKYSNPKLKVVCLWDQPYPTC